jgi:HEAT repeat protein
MVDATATLDRLEADMWRELYRCRYDQDHREATISVLADLLGNPSSEVHQRALRAVGRIGLCDVVGALSALVPLVCRYTQDPDLLTRRTAVGVLHGVGRDNPDVAVPALVRACGDDSLMDAALLALISIGRNAQTAIPCFHKCATHSKGKIRRLAMRGLGATNADDDQSRSILQGALEDRNQRVREMAQRVLSEIQPQT